MKTYSDDKPKIFESIENRAYRYNYNIKEIKQIRDGYNLVISFIFYFKKFKEMINELWQIE